MMGAAGGRRRGTLTAVLAVVAGTLAVIMGAAAPARGADITVTRFDDPAPGLCTPTDCSLREGIIAANILGGPDVITLPAGTYTLTRAGTGDDFAASGDLDIRDSLTINGAGSATTAIDATGIDRVFHVPGAIPPLTFSLRDLTITGGAAPNGGGIFFAPAGTPDSTLRLSDVVVSGNGVTDDGGGIWSRDVVELTTVTIADNWANGDGGGLYLTAGGELTMTDTTVRGNRADFDDSGTGAGGGVFHGSLGTSSITDSVIGPLNAARRGGGLLHAGGTLNVSDATIEDNSAIYGAGIWTEGRLTVASSTIHANQAVGDPADSPAGGGIAIAGGVTTFSNVTVSGNRATTAIGGIGIVRGAFTGRGITVTANTAAEGGGVHVSFEGSLRLGGSIVAGNIDAEATTVDPDCVAATGDVITLGSNIVGDSSGCSWPAGGAGDQVGTSAAPLDPLLGPLADNGGPVATHALLPGSPALNAVPPAACIALLGASPSDARATTRPQGVGCDIGAYEARLPTEAPDTYRAVAGQTLSVPAPGVLGNDTNPEAGPLTAAKVTDPAHGTVALAADGSFTYTPAAAFSGTDSFTYQAVNIAGAVNTTAVTIAVTAPPTTTTTMPPPVADTVGLVDVDQGRWYLRNAAGVVTSFFYGNPVDLPIAGDWDGNGVATPGLYRQSDGFFYARDSNTEGPADNECFAGNPEDVPVVGDWDGDGDDNLGIYRPTEQVFYLFTITCTGSPMGAAQISMLFGNPGDQPTAGDWDGDGIDEVGLYRESSGFFYWRNTLDTGVASGEIFFGDPGDRFVAGDWGIVDGADTPAVFRHGDLTYYFRHTLTEGVADSQFQWVDPASAFGLYLGRIQPPLPVAGAFGLG